MKVLKPGALAAFALLVHAGLVLLGNAHHAVTIDEFGHLPAGIAYLQRGGFEVNPQPPLVKMLGAAAALAAGARPDYEHSWRAAEALGATPHYPDLARDFMRANADPPGHYHRIFRAARLATLPFSVLLGAVLFFWGRDLFGAWGGLLALCLWCFSPNAIGHAALFTSDVPAASLMLTATYCFWRWLRAPGMAGAVACGALLGLAQLVKLSALSLYGLWPLMALPALLGAGGEWRSRIRGLAPGALAILGISVFVINAGYGFQGTGHRLGEPDYLSTTLTRYRSARVEVAPHDVYAAVYAMRVNRFRNTPLESIPVPLPRAFLAGFDLQSFEARPQLPGAGWFTYLRGEVRMGGWWYYFLYALLVKSTPALLVLLAAATLALGLSPKTRLRAVDEAFVWLPPALLLASMSAAGVNLGVRYALPALPFLMLTTGRLAQLLPARPVAWSLGAVAFLHAATALGVGTHALSYFSPLVGGSSAGYRHLADSNLDWGQELLHLRSWLEARGVEGPISAALYTSVDPTVLGIETRMIPRDPRTLGATPGVQREPDEPRCLEPGLHIVSANYVAGLPFRLVPANRVVNIPTNAYAYFADVEPHAHIGHSLRVYDLSPEDARALNRQARLICPRAVPRASPGAN
ncbi:MAG: glycosyltransferase family 39 protein [Deltaproteobacteria bacterium]|nr:glycosyltransferase family 39 protein [Deltaproteobacteria bacterium]MBW2445689.1 glycosyltransferase family 39 protein [Deltaproteobacteria bacterium]